MPVYNVMIDQPWERTTIIKVVASTEAEAVRIAEEKAKTLPDEMWALHPEKNPPEVFFRHFVPAVWDRWTEAPCQHCYWDDFPQLTKPSCEQCRGA